METEDVAPSGVFIAGGGFFGNPGDNAMTDEDGDGIYSITVEVAAGFSSYYTFTNGACGDWSCKENLAGLPCGDPNNYNDRFLPEVYSSIEVSTCFGQCSTDGTCNIYGCVDSQACNFDEGANADDASCEYPPEFYNCDGVCIADSDGDGICDELEILGCTFDAADNFDPFATEDDGSCEVPGCIISIACNYNPSATYDDGSCFFSCPGCTDSVACNYDPDALQENGSCQYPFDIYGADNLDCDGNCLNDEDGDGVCTEDEVFGCTDAIACNYVLDATEEDESCEYETCAGCMDEIACNYDPAYTIEDEASCEYESCVGCMYEFACNYDPEATIADNESCEFGTCPGCTDAEACNYNPTVIEDDGTCFFPTPNHLQIAGTIDGEEGAEFGESVSISADGSRVAIGGPSFDSIPGIGWNIGLTRIYDLDEDGWQQIGQDLFGDDGDLSGDVVSLSGDGTTVATLSPDNGGKVRIYEWSGLEWTPKGNIIEGAARSMSLSENGNIVAIGDPFSLGNGNSFYYTRGTTKIYQLSGDDWIQVGENIDGQTPGEWSGYSVSLASDGSTVAIGAPYHNQNGMSFDNDFGHTRVFEWSGIEWTQIGEDINGNYYGSHSGTSVSLTGDGTMVAIGAPDGYWIGGRVSAHKWNGVEWEQLGDDIDGEQPGAGNGRTVSLSDDGTILSIGSPWYNTSEVYSGGSLRVFQLFSTGWIQLGQSMYGETDSASLGKSTALSADGQTLGFGLSSHVNGTWSGEARVFSVAQPCPE